METCPWSGWAPATLQFCERRLCAWITEPSNTWSNLFFIIAGFLIWRAARRCERSDLLIVGGSAVFLGLASGIFHASGTFFFEFFDLSGMFLISSMMVTLNARRWLNLSTWAVVVTFLALTISAMVLLSNWRLAGIPIFGTHLAISLTIEVVLHIRGDQVKYRNMLLMVGAFVIAFGFWVGDVTGRLCNPDNHFITGHAIWHTLNAVAIWYLYRFYLQFDQTKRDSKKGGHS